MLPFALYATLSWLALKASHLLQSHASHKCVYPPMRIPSDKILAHIPSGCETIELRNPDFTLANSALPFSDALIKILRGEVEGVGTTNKLRYLRILSESERKTVDLDPPPVINPYGPGGGCHLPGNTRQGVYKQRLDRVEVKEEYGFRAAAAGDLNSERQIIGWTYTHYGTAKGL
jgi:hypothetical protein